MERDEVIKAFCDELTQMVKKNTKEVLTSREAADYLGVSVSQIYRLTCKSEIPHYKPTGKMCYFKREELDEWATQNRINTAREAEQAAQDFCNKRRCAL